MDQIEVLNLVPKFLNFYEKAHGNDLNDDERWSLWEKHYNFAAVPPGEEGKKLAKQLFQEAWPQYHRFLTFIKDWKPDQNQVENCLIKIKSLLGCNQSISLVVVYFVGFLEKNAFVAPFDSQRMALCLPIENGDSEITLSHELTHIVHSKTANLSGDWERTIASTILQEGLAMQVSKAIVPGFPDENYVEFKKGWFDSCKGKKLEILNGILPFLEDSSSESVTKFTFGNGTTNNEREAYFAGWVLVQYLLDQGVSFKRLAGIQENNIPEYLRGILLECLS